MLKMNCGYRHSHYGTEMQLKLTQVGGMSECYHTSIMRTWTQLAKDNLALLGQEELNAPDTSTSKGLSYLIGHYLCLLQSLIAYLIWLPRLTVVACLLYVSDWRTEQCGPTILLCNGEQGKLRIKVDKLLDDYLFHIATTTFHSLLKGLLQLVVVVYIALTVTR